MGHANHFRLFSEKLDTCLAPHEFLGGMGKQSIVIMENIKKLPWYAETTRAFKDQILQFKLKSFSKGFMRASPGKLFASSSRSPSRGEKYRFHFCR